MTTKDTNGKAYPNDIRLAGGSREEIAQRVYAKIIQGITDEELLSDMVIHVQASYAAADAMIAARGGK